MAITTAVSDLFGSFYELISSVLGAAYAIVSSLVNAVVGFVAGIFSLAGDIASGAADIAGGVGKFALGTSGPRAPVSRLAALISCRKHRRPCHRRRGGVCVRAVYGAGTTGCGRQEDELIRVDGARETEMSSGMIRAP